MARSTAPNEQAMSAPAKRAMNRLQRAHASTRSQIASALRFDHAAVSALAAQCCRARQCVCTLQAECRSARVLGQCATHVLTLCCTVRWLDVRVCTAALTALAALCPTLLPPLLLHLLQCIDRPDSHMQARTHSHAHLPCGGCERIGACITCDGAATECTVSFVQSCRTFNAKQCESKRMFKQLMRESEASEKRKPNNEMLGWDGDNAVEQRLGRSRRELQKQ